MTTRINKYLSEVGYCSRRRADILIEEGKVTINGKIPEIGSKVKDGDQVIVEGQRIEKSTKQKNIYLAFNKPVGIVCTIFLSDLLIAFSLRNTVRSFVTGWGEKDKLMSLNALDIRFTAI